MKKYGIPNILQEMSENNIFKQVFHVTRELRSKKLNQKPVLIWFTGLSGSGKTTISNFLEKLLFDKGYSTFSLDGDNIRNGLSKDLTFSEKDRYENIRRIAEVSKLFLDSGIIVLASFISPLKNQRDLVKTIVGEKNFIEVFIKTPIEVCEKRDVKGLYKKARNGEIKNFTGISSKYELPLESSFEIDTSKLSVQESVNFLYEKIINEINE